MAAETKRPDPMIGKTLNSTYTLERRIGRGGMGRVYAGQHLRLSRPVAIKVLQSKFSSSPDAVERFRHEARSASALGHPNIVQVFDFNQSEDRAFYIVMELLEGEDLRSLLKREQKLAPLEALAILKQVCDALDLAHSKGLIHRDLKPSNLFLRTLPGRREVKILDFGVAKILGADLGLTMDGAMLGTPHYMAPEQAAGEGGLSPRVDIYAMGTVLFEMLTGKRPFEADSPLTILHLRATRPPPAPSSIVPSLSKEIDAVVLRALARDPADRFESPTELALAFEKALVRTSPRPSMTIAEDPREPDDDDDDDYDDGPADQGEPTVGSEHRPSKDLSSETILASTSEASNTPASQTGSSVIQLKSSDELRMATIVAVTVSPAEPEEADPDEVLELTEALLKRMSEAIVERGGVIEQDIGDALVAVFGVPTATGDDPAQAVRAGLAVQALGREQAVKGIETRIGIQTGRILRRHGRAGVTGEVVKIATRLADECPAGEVLVGHQAYDHIRGAFDVSFREQLNLRGQKQPLRTYRVTGERDHAVVLEPRGEGGAGSQLVGRDPERDFLRGLYLRAAREQQAQAVLLIGGPGSGKTRLVQELLAALDEQSERLNYFTARAAELSTPSPYGLFAEMIRIKLGARALEPKQAAKKLVELIQWPFTPQLKPNAGATGASSGLTTLMTVKPALPPLEIARAIGAAIGLQIDGEEAAGKETAPEKLAFAFSVFLHALGRLQPVVFVLDDLHRADEETLDLMELILRECEDAPVLFLGLARPSFLESRPAFMGGVEHLTTIQLRSLSAAAVTAQIGALLGGPAPAGLGPAIHGRSGGNPHLVEEMVRALRDTGDLCQEEGEGSPWVYMGNLKDLDVPSRAEALLQARLDQLTAPDRELLRCAAVIGEVFWEGALVELGLDQVEARLDALAQSDLVRLRPASRFPSTRQWAFKSELMAEVARSNLPVRDRKQIHQSMAEWLGRQDQRDPDTLGLRAHHLMEAGQRSAALDVMAEAGRLSERQMRWQVALASYMRAYELARSEGDEASSLYFATHVGRLGVRAHTPSKSVDVLKQSAELAEKSGEEAMQANLLQLLGRSLAIQGNHERAREVTEQALQVADKRGDLRLKFETTKALGFVLYYADNFEGSAKAFEQCLEIARQLGDEDEVALNIYNVADSSLSAGDLDRALEFANQAVAACAGREKVAFLRPMAGGISAYVRALRQGDAGARVELEQWIVDADEHGYLDQQLDARFFLASVLEKQGLRAEALAVARTGQEIARQAESAQSVRRFTDLIAKLQ